MPVLSFDDYYTQYVQSHPGVSLERVRRKYEFAHSCMFGTKQPTDTQRRRTTYTSPSEIREVFKYVREQVAAQSLKERTSKTRSGKILRVSPIIPKRPKIKHRKAPPLPRPLHQVPLIERPGFVTISSDGECALYDWMHEILAKFDPLPPGTPLRPVYMQTSTGIYAFGVCGGFGDRESLFAVLTKSPYFRYLHHKDLSANILLEREQLDFREKYKHLSLQREIMDRVGDFLIFVSDPRSKVAMITWSRHARLLIKDPERDRVIVIDPHGEMSNPTDSNFIIERLTIALEILEDHPYKTVEYERHRQDQLGEGSCATVAFLRALYILFCSNTTGREPIYFINERIPCVVAVFVSILLQQRGVIKGPDHDKIMAELREYESLMAEEHDIKEQLQPIIRRILPLLVLTKKMLPRNARKMIEATEPVAASTARAVYKMIRSVPHTARRIVTDPQTFVRDVAESSVSAGKAFHEKIIGPSIARLLPNEKIYASAGAEGASAGAGGV